MTLDEFIEHKKSVLDKQLERFKSEWTTRYPDEMPDDGVPETAEDWDAQFTWSCS